MCVCVCKITPPASAILTLRFISGFIKNKEGFDYFISNLSAVR